jgi:S1-C subfamily serine protease
MTPTPTVGASTMREIVSSRKMHHWQPTFGPLIPIRFRPTNVPMRALVATLAIGVWVFQLALAPTTAAGDPLGGPAQETAKLQDVAGLERLEARVSDAIQKALPAIVAVDHPGPGTSPGPRSSHFAGAHGSGVIISPDGLILSQWHVSHEGAKGEILNAGDEIDVVLQDGRRLKAELLGA